MTTAFYTHADCQRHEMGDWHPETPLRLQAIEDQLIAQPTATPPKTLKHPRRAITHHLLPA